MRPTRIKGIICMKSFIIMMLCFLAFTGCTSKTNTTESSEPKAELNPDATSGSEKNYPKYDMNDFDTKALAQIMVEEKEAGVPNDSAFAAFFHRCGMEYGEWPKESEEIRPYSFGMEGFYKIYSNQSYIAVNSIYDSDDGKQHHKIEIEFSEEDTNRLQWMIVQLRKFGMKDVESEAVKLEGKGLLCIGMRGRLSLLY